MKRPFWYPQSLLARTLWLVVLVLLFSKALTLAYILSDENTLVDRQFSHGLGLALRAYWAADPEDRERIAQVSGITMVAPQEVPEGDYHWLITPIFDRQMRAELGADIQLRYQEKIASLWVLAPALGPDWVRLPVYPQPLTNRYLLRIVGWLFGIAVISTGSAFVYILVSSRPHQRLVNAAREFGRGRKVRLPEYDAINETAELYRAFNQMFENVEQAAKEQQLMLAGVSHDLRTPLTRLRLSAELMKNDPELREEMIRDIEDVDQVLDQFLAFVRDGRDEVDEEGDLAQLIDEVAKAYNGNRQLVRVSSARLPVFPFRRVSMKRLLTNLIENALRHGGVEGVEVVTRLAGQAKGPYIALSVLDRGPGLPEEELQRLFDPFVRGDRARGGKGTGLGLAIVKRIAAQHGGSVQLHNRPGGGLEARVLLPLGLVLPRDAV